MVESSKLKEYEAVCGSWRGRVWACSSAQALAEAALILSRHAKRERWRDVAQRDLRVEYIGQ